MNIMVGLHLFRRKYGCKLNYTVYLNTKLNFYAARNGNKSRFMNHLGYSNTYFHPINLNE